MRASLSLRGWVIAFLAAAAFAALFGIVGGASAQGPGGPGVRVAERIAVDSGHRTDRRRHRKQHKIRRHHNGHGQAPETGTGAGSGSDQKKSGEKSPGLGEAEVAGGQGSGNGSHPTPTGGNPTPPATPPTTPTGPTTPPVQPIPIKGCFHTPSSCGYPDPTNTGVPAGTTLTPSGSISVNKAGTTISGVDVTGTIQILANNVTIQNSRVTQTSTCGPTSSCGNYAIAIAPDLTGIKIAHVETRTTAGATCEQDIRNTGASVTIEDAYLHGCDGNLYAVGPTVLKDSYGVAKIDISTDHIENIYFNETSFSAIHDTLLNPVNQTAVIFGNSGGGTDVTNCSNQLTVQESLLAGGGYSLYPCAHSSQPGSSTLNVIGNHFARCLTTATYEAAGGHHPCSGGFDNNGFYPNSGSYGIASDYYTGTGTWRGNVWDDNLGKVCIDGRSSGCE
jgi:hypothetical protein